MLSKAFTSSLAKDLPVLFCYIGWTDHYNGTEAVIGNHGYLKTHPKDTAESQAFVKDKDGFFNCWIGEGQAPSSIHIVFVALDPSSRVKKLVGVYAKATVETGAHQWAHARTKDAVLIPAHLRPAISGWPGMQGIRRWAKREAGISHSTLLKVFNGLKGKLPKLLKKPTQTPTPIDQIYAGMEAREGEKQKQLVTHRRREFKLRNAKIKQVLSLNEGKLVCEVPRCGFDFYRKYGDLGYGYAHVHHLIPLAKTGKEKTTKLDDLAIVCANCHAMIHRKGGCRELNGLLPKKPRKHA